jgi:hypothetical protein
LGIALATAKDVIRIATALEGTTSAPHFDRTAFKVRRIYATLAGDGKTINVDLTPDEQAFKVMMAPAIYSRIPNGWGRRGATTVNLAQISGAELTELLTPCWEHGRSKTPIHGKTAR